MLPDQVSNPGPMTYESGDLPIALRGPAEWANSIMSHLTWIYIVCKLNYFHFHKISVNCEIL